MGSNLLLKLFKGNLHTEVSISEEEVKIPLPEELYEKVKGKRVVIVPKG